MIDASGGDIAPQGPASGTAPLPRLRRIAFLCQRPFSRRDYQRYGVAYLLDHGIEVTIYDLTHLIHPTLPESEPEDLPAGLAQPTVITNWRQWAGVQAALATADLIVCEIGSGYCRLRDYPVFRALAKLSVPSLSFLCNAVPAWDLRFEQTSWARRIATSVTQSQVLDSLFRRLPLGMVGLRPIDFAVYGGTASHAGQPMVSAATREIWAHTMDYELALAEGGIDAANDGAETPARAVFVDQGLGFHADFDASGTGQIVDVESFHANLNALFRRIEAELGLEVVIAAHPRSPLDTLERLFPGRKIEAGRTRELIAASRLVVMTFSTAVSWCVMYRKPVLFLTAASIEAALQTRGEVAMFAQGLNKAPQFVDAPARVDLTGALDIDTGAYDAYYRRYIKTTDDRRTFWDIIAGEICGETLPAAAA